MCESFVGYAVFERMTYNGIVTNLVLYLTRELNEGTVKSSYNVTTWVGTAWLTPLLGAYIADAHWTFMISSASYLAVHFTQISFSYFPGRNINKHFLSSFFVSVLHELSWLQNTESRHNLYLIEVLIMMYIDSLSISVTGNVLIDFSSFSASSEATILRWWWCETRGLR